MWSAGDLKRWNDYKDFLISRYGFPVYRIGVDGGFSCPNRAPDRSGGCVYCDALGASASYARTKESGFTRRSEFESVPPQSGSACPGSDIESRIAGIKVQIERGRAFVRRRYCSDKVSLYFQAYTNTFASVEDLRRIYSESLQMGPFVELIVSTRPDCLGLEVISLLGELRTQVQDLWVELGLQSGSDRILGLMNRGHSSACWLDASQRAADAGLDVCSHVILGFPSETEQELDATIDLINRSPVKALKIHNLHITAQSRLLEDYFDGEITAASEARHLENTEYVLRRIRPDIVIERLMCETPSHRLAAPRCFPDKSLFLADLRRKMENDGAFQGDLCRKQSI